MIFASGLPHERHDEVVRWLAALCRVHQRVQSIQDLAEIMATHEQNPQSQTKQRAVATKIPSDQHLHILRAFWLLGDGEPWQSPC